MRVRAWRYKGFRMSTSTFDIEFIVDLFTDELFEDVFKSNNTKGSALETGKELQMRRVSTDPR